MALRAYLSSKTTPARVKHGVRGWTIHDCRVALAFHFEADGVREQKNNLYSSLLRAFKTSIQPIRLVMPKWTHIVPSLRPGSGSVRHDRALPSKLLVEPKKVCCMCRTDHCNHTFVILALLQCCTSPLSTPALARATSPFVTAVPHHVGHAPRRRMQKRQGEKFTKHVVRGAPVADVTLIPGCGCVLCFLVFDLQQRSRWPCSISTCSFRCSAEFENGNLRKVKWHLLTSQSSQNGA